MFFPEKIRNIKPDDCVLEVGPGGTPHPRSDVFLEKVFPSEEIAEAQRGYTPKLDKKNTVFYDGDVFPFEDGKFDYVICSHVLEHVYDVKKFIKEIFRVAKRGYLEYPLVYYDYIYNFPEHLTFLKFKHDKLYYMHKSAVPLSQFSEVSKFFYESLKAGHTSLIDSLEQELFEGFEWDAPFKIEEAKSINEVCWENIQIKTPIKKRSSLIYKIKEIMRRILI